MTLNFTQTAPDCHVFRYLTPLIAQHFDRVDGRWHIKDGNTFTRPWETRPGPAVHRFLMEIGDMLPGSTYWDRTRYRLGNIGSTYLVRSMIQMGLDMADLWPCPCGRTCKHPDIPDWTWG